ncbi:MAG: hypothetical protein HY717_12995 [Planctomycetes bacterium]|nr:hypothetical protein [Planctomycetota bacterium]
MDNTIHLKNLQVSASLEDVVRIGVVIFKNLAIGGPNPALQQAIEGTAEELRRSLGDRRPSSLPPVERTRRLYHQVGIDPTKNRPSSEKLLRRVLHKRPFPRINNFVDAMNLVSVRLQFPLGLYDWDRLAPPVLLRIGSPDEKYRTTAGDEINLEGKLVLVDGEGPFGNPTHDSKRAMIHAGTVRALVVIFAPADVPRRELEEAIAEILAAGGEHCSGRPWVTGILP